MLGFSFFFISQVARILWLDNSVVMKLLQLFSHCSLAFLSKTFESIIDTVFFSDDLIFDNIGWWSGFNKGGYGFDDVDIGIGYIMKGAGTNNQVYPHHGALIGSSIIVVGGGSIP